MARFRWIISNRFARFYYRNQVLGYVLILFIITVLLLCLGYCSVQFLNKPFEGVQFRSIHAPENDGSVLVTYERYGEIFGRTFADKNAALAFAESIR